MRNRQHQSVYRWVVFLLGLAAVVLLLSVTNMVDSTAQISPQPTHTWTPRPPTDTPTPIPPTDTPTPVPPTDTPTPLPPTDTPVPDLLDLGPISVAPTDGVISVDASLSATAPFTITNLSDLDSVIWSWGDGTLSTCPPDSAACSADAGDGTSGFFTGSHVYGQPGVYAVQITAATQFGQSDGARYEFVVVYDPDAGFVTGGGWLYSPPGAYAPHPDLEGKASFGFVSRYRKGAALPDGNTQFEFHAAGLNFRSTDYDWLVVTGGNDARFKGSGTINGEGDYDFMLWARDHSPDTFRIRIWSEDTGGIEHTIYDNGADQEIGGGAIVVHDR